MVGLSALFVLQATALLSLVDGLGSDSAAHRERCEGALVRCGEAALPILRRAEQRRDPEVSWRARQARQRICSRLPGSTPDSSAANLHDLALGVQRISGKTLLWCEELGLRDCPVTFKSSRLVEPNPELLWSIFEEFLHAYELWISEFMVDGRRYYMIKAMIRSTKASRLMKNTVIKLWEGRDEKLEGLMITIGYPDYE